MLHYLDIETTGLDSEKDKVITVQFAKIDFKTGMMVQPINVIAEWLSSEEDILEKAYSFLMEGDEWNFVPCGYNILHFDLPFLFSRFQSVLKKPVTYEFLNRPTLDLKSTFILMNGGRFKGSNRFIKKMDRPANLYLNGMNGKNMIRLRRTYQWKQMLLGKHSVNFGID